MGTLLFQPLLTLHICSGLVALAAGLVAMSVRKSGGGLHARAGDVFQRAMSAMALSAAFLTAWEPDQLSLGAAVWTFYLVQSGRSAARAGVCAATGGLRWWMPLGLVAVALFIQGGVTAAMSPTGEYQGSAAAAYGVFAALATLASSSDLKLFRRTRLAPRRRIARHLWRMVFAYLLAVTSLFLGQQDDVFPLMAGSPLLLLPSLLTLMFLTFWAWRARFGSNWLGAGPRIPRDSPVAQSKEETA